MGFEDRLRSALDMAVKHYNEGCTPDEACCKTACACEFNSDQTDRLVEVMNTAITINQYKQAEDRTANFPIAHKDRVAAMMMDADTVLGTKKGEKRANVYFEYMTSARPQRTRIDSDGVLEKAASFESKNVYENMTVENVADLAMRQINMKKNAGAYAKDVAGRIHGQLVTDLYALADDVKKIDNDSYAVFKSAAASDIVERLERVLPEKFSKVSPASGFVDDTKVAEFVERAENMHDSYEFMKEMIRQEKELSKMAENMQDDLLSACGVIKKEKSAGVVDWLKMPYLFAVGQGGQSGRGVVSDMGKALISAEQSEDQDPEEVRKNTERSILLQELLARDEVLKDADRDSVVSAYNTLLNTAPDVASDKELVKSILRQAVAATAISPFDADQWAKLNGRMNGRKMEA